MIRPSSLLMSIFLFCFVSGLAQPRLVQESIDVPVEQWIGQKFIFLEKPKSLRQFGYFVFLTKEHPFRGPICDPELEVERTHGLRYSRFVGKIITARTLSQDSLGLTVTFVEDSTNLTLYARPYKGLVHGIALVSELLKARARWVGKTIYSKKKYITIYDSESDSLFSLKVAIGSPLKVTEVRWSVDSGWPIWLGVETAKGEKGYLETKFSWTNWYSDGWRASRPWEDDFSESGPR